MLLSPLDMFRTQVDLYTLFDEEGIPTHDAAGESFIIFHVHDMISYTVYKFNRSQLFNTVFNTFCLNCFHNFISNKINKMYSTLFYHEKSEYKLTISEIFQIILQIVIIDYSLGEKISKSAYKKLRKDWEKQKKLFDASSAAK